MKCFATDFFSSMHARIVIFNINVNDYYMYREIENQPSPAYSPCCGIENQASPAYSSLYLSNFLSFYTLRVKFFVKDSSIIMQAKMVIFDMQVDKDYLSRWAKNQSSSVYSSMYLSNFLSFHTLKNEMFRQRFLLNHAN